MDIRPIDANALEDQLGVSDRDIYVKDCLNEQPTITLNDLRDAIYADAVAHGLWDDADRWAKCWDFKGEEFVRKNLWNAAAQSVRSEAVELVEVSANDIYQDTDNREHFTEELADVVIMCFSVAGKLGIDIDAAIRRKMEINKGRPWKHGKSNE